MVPAESPSFRETWPKLVAGAFRVQAALLRTASSAALRSVVVFVPEATTVDVVPPAFAMSVKVPAASVSVIGIATPITNVLTADWPPYAAETNEAMPAPVYGGHRFGEPSVSSTTETARSRFAAAC